VPSDETNDRGELTFAEQTRLLNTLPGSEHLEPEVHQYCSEHDQPLDWCFHRATPHDDPWYDAPPGPPVLPEIMAAWAQRKKRMKEPLE